MLTGLKVFLITLIMEIIILVIIDKAMDEIEFKNMDSLLKSFFLITVVSSLFHWIVGYMTRLATWGPRLVARFFTFGFFSGASAIGLFVSLIMIPINIAIFYITAKLIEGFEVKDIKAAAVASVSFSVATIILGFLIS